MVWFDVLWYGMVKLSHCAVPYCGKIKTTLICNFSTMKLFPSTYSLGDFIDFHIKKAAIFIEMLPLEHPFSYHLVRHLAFGFHHKFQHFIIRLSWKCNLSRVQLEDCTGNGPKIYGIIIGVANN